MAKSRSWQWDHFHMGGKQNSAFRKAYCRYCINVKLKEIIARDESDLAEGRLEAARQQEAQSNEAQSSTLSTTGRIDIMNNHLIACQFVPSAVKQRASAYKEQNKDVTGISGASGSTKKRTRSDSASAELQKDHTSKRQQNFQVLSVKAIPYTGSKQSSFENQLLKAFVSSGTAFNKVDDPEVQRLFADFAPSAKLPTRQRLEKEILHRVVVQMEGEMKTSVRGKLATLSCDGWKDVSKRHLVAFMITVDQQTHTLHVYDVSSKRKTAANMLPLMEKECDYVEKELGAIMLGWCGDAAGDVHRGRFDLVLLRPWYLSADCWAHQVLLILGDLIKKNPAIKTLIEEVVEIIKWFNNHSYALGVFNEEQQIMNKKTLAFVVPVITRWTAYYLSMDRLLQIWKPLQITAIKHETTMIESVGRNPQAKAKAKQIIDRVQDNNWWKQVTKVKTQIEPLAIAVNVAQAGNIRCDQILLLLGKLYKTYQDTIISERVDKHNSTGDKENEVATILDSIERRWTKADQDLHIGAFVLNPYLNRKLLNQSKITGSVIIGILRRLYERLFQAKELPSDLMRSIYNYYERTDMFSPDLWILDELEDGMKEDGSFNPLKAWKLLDPDNPLVKLAERVLSFCPNSASAERLFSTMGNIKTKKRNRMHTQKLRDLAFLQLELRQQQAKAGLVRQRLKRSFGNKATHTPGTNQKSTSQFGLLDDLAVVEEVGHELSEGTNFDEEDTDAEEQNEATGSSFRSLLETHISSDANEEEDLPGTSVDQEPSGPSMPQRVRVFFGQQRHISIENLFNWNVEEGWDKYWFEGVKNCRQEMEFYDLVLSAEKDISGDMGNNEQTAVDKELGASSQPIVIQDT